MEKRLSMIIFGIVFIALILVMDRNPGTVRSVQRTELSLFSLAKERDFELELKKIR